MNSPGQAQTIGQRLKLARETFSIFRAEVAATTDGTSDQIRDIEEGRAEPNAEQLQRISLVYGLRLEWLQTGQGAPCAIRSAEGLELSAVYRISIWGDPELPRLVPAIHRDLIAMGFAEVSLPPTLLFYWCLANWPEISGRIAKDLGYCRNEGFETMNEFCMASIKAQLAAREANGDPAA